MAVPPRKIRQLPPAQAPSDTDVFPVSQMNTNTGIATTRAMSRVQLQSDLIEVINEARQQLVNNANTEHAELRGMLNVLQNRIESNETLDSNIQTAIAMVQQMIAEGDGGKSAYQLWMELPGNSGKTVQQYFDAMTGPPGTTSWAGITDKPSQFTPSPHTHSLSEVIGAQSALDGKANLSHTHNEGDIVGLSSSLDQLQDKISTLENSSAPPAWASITGRPSTYPPSAHTHAISEITGLQSSLNTKPNVPGALILGDVDITDQAVVALVMGIRFKDVTVPASWGLRATDTLFATAAAALPSGYAIDNAIPLSTTSVRVYFMGPTLAVLSSNVLKVRIAAIGRLT